MLWQKGCPDRVDLPISVEAGVPTRPSAATLNTYSHVTNEVCQRAAVKINQGIAKAEAQVKLQ